METRRVATVFGGSGFIGRYVVKRLAQQGYIVRVAVRDTEGAAFLKPSGTVGQIVPLYASLHEPATITRAVAGAHLVVNAVGILAERHASDFTRIHAEGAGMIARDCAANGVERLVHISAIGADPASPSAYGKSKGEGEHAVHAEYPPATILRPSIVFGPEDRFLNRFAGVALISPFMPVISGDTKFQPVYVVNVAEAVMAALSLDDAVGKVFELGGPKVWTFRGLLAWLLDTIDRRRQMVDIPMSLARVQAAFMEKLPGKPLTRDQLLMLSRDNVVAPGMPGLMDLGVTPAPIELAAPPYLIRFRRGGAFRNRYAALQDTKRT